MRYRTGLMLRALWRLAPALLLGACVIDGPERPQHHVQPAVPARAAEPETAPAPIAAPGYLRFALSPSSAGNYFGWRIRVLQAAGNQAFKPFTSSPMNAGTNLVAELWPDRYRVQVLLLDAIEQEEWVTVAGGRMTSVDVGIGFLLNTITTAPPVATGSGGPPAVYRQPIDQTYGPMTVALRPGLEGRYHGPQIEGHPAGRGRLDLVANGRDIARIPNAEVVDGRFTGDPVFADGRAVETPMLAGYTYSEETVTRWPDGRRFQGRYEGLEPNEGVLDFLDGSQWTGFLDRGAPSGTGRLVTADGTIFPTAPGNDPARFDGRFACVTPAGISDECLYFNGKRIASTETYADLVREREQASRAMEMAELAATAQATPGQQAGACGTVSGRFTANGGLSRLTFDGRGSGGLWQHTFLDLDPHTFEIDFTYAVEGGSIRFDYGPGVYKDMHGRVVRRQNIPGGTVPCSFDGLVVAIDGKPYTRE